MESCIFCKIARGVIPAHIIYEDDDIVAFLDISQSTKGHTLVVTKEHYENFLYVPKSLLDKAINVAQKIAQAQVTQLGAKGNNILINVNPVAGQSVMHFHIHVIPRYDDSEGSLLSFEHIAIAENLLPALAENLKKGL